MELRPHDPDSLWEVTLFLNPDGDVRGLLDWTVFDDGTSRMGNTMLTKEQTSQLLDDALGYVER